jgi:hypothetical protein
MYAMRQVEEDPDGGQDFFKMIQLEKIVVKLQAIFRSKLTRRKIARDAELNRIKIEQKKLRARSSPEQLAIKEFITALKRKANLTPEAFFRACDFKYEQKISNEFFKLQLTKYGL